MHLAIATAPGFTHVNPGQPGKINNQDAFAIREFDQSKVIVVCDGCGSQPYSEYGAQFGANAIANAIKEQLVRNVMPNRINWDRVTAKVVNALKAEVQSFMTNESQAEFDKITEERFLFTSIALVVVGDMALVAAFGDGIIVIDDDVIDLNVPITNAPPYISYLLLSNSAYHAPGYKAYLNFIPIRTMSISKLYKGIVIGTDGLRNLSNDDLHHPALVQPKSLQRWLNAITAEKIDDGKIVLGQCSDDVTLVILRSEEAQTRLFALRIEIADLKRMILALEPAINEFASSLNRMKLTEEEANEKVKEIEVDLTEAWNKATAIKSFENRITGFKQRVAKLKAEIPAKAKKPLTFFEKYVPGWYYPPSTDFGTLGVHDPLGYHFPKIHTPPAPRTGNTQSLPKSNPKDKKGKEKGKEEEKKVVTVATPAVVPPAPVAKVATVATPAVIPPAPVAKVATVIETQAIVASVKEAAVKVDSSETSSKLGDKS